MAAYSSNEIVDIILVLGEAGRNYCRAERLYRNRYPFRRHPNAMQIRRILLRERRRIRKRNRKQINAEDDVNDPRVLAVLAMINLNPHISTRELQRNLGIPYVTVWRILQRHKFHPYHITLTQDVSENDMRLRRQFCRWALRMIREDPTFFQYVLFSDEASFHNNGQLNRHNCIYWSTYNPHWTQRVDNQHRWSLNTWCGIVNGYLIGPYFFDNRLNGETYLSFLQNKLPELLEEVDLATRQKMWWQQDGAPPHSHRIVMEYLNNIFHERWIGRYGYIRWPPRSPDLTSCDFFLWGYIKNIVYKTPPTSAGDMKNRITNVCRSIPQNILISTVENFEKRLRLCLQENGAPFEHLINS